jgi:hypothetical protein
LLDWRGFQSLFEERWRATRIKCLDDLGRILREYVDPGHELEAAFDKLSERNKELYRDLREKYYYLGFLCAYTTLASELKKGVVRQVEVQTGENLVLAIKEIQSEVEYFDFLMDLCEQGIEAFDNLMGRQYR